MRAAVAEEALGLVTNWHLKEREVLSRAPRFLTCWQSYPGKESGRGAVWGRWHSNLDSFCWVHLDSKVQHATGYTIERSQLAFATNSVTFPCPSSPKPVPSTSGEFS